MEIYKCTNTVSQPLLSTHDLLGLLKQVVANPPYISALPSEQFATSHVEDLPSIEPHRSLVLAICLLQMWPYLLFAGGHLRNPILKVVSFSSWV